MAKVRRRSGAMRLVQSLANDALDFAAANYTAYPASVANRLEVTFREIAANLPKEIRCSRKSK